MSQNRTFLFVPNSKNSNEALQLYQCSLDSLYLLQQGARGFWSTLHNPDRYDEDFENALKLLFPQSTLFSYFTDTVSTKETKFHFVAYAQRFWGRFGAQSRTQNDAGTRLYQEAVNILDLELAKTSRLQQLSETVASAFSSAAIFLGLGARPQVSSVAAESKQENVVRDIGPARSTQNLPVTPSIAATSVAADTYRAPRSF